MVVDLKKILVTHICLRCLHWDSTGALSHSINELFRDCAKITLSSPLLLVPILIPGPATFSPEEKQAEPIRSKLNSQRLPAFQHPSSSSATLTLSRKSGLQTTLRLVLLLEKLFPVGSNALFCSPEQSQLVLSDPLHWIQHSWPPTFTGRIVLIFQPPRRHFWFSLRLC